MGSVRAQSGAHALPHIDSILAKPKALFNQRNIERWVVLTSSVLLWNTWAVALRGSGTTFVEEHVQRLDASILEQSDVRAGDDIRATHRAHAPA